MFSQRLYCGNVPILFLLCMVPVNDIQWTSNKDMARKLENQTQNKIYITASEMKKKAWIAQCDQRTLFFQKVHDEEILQIEIFYTKRV